MLAELIIPKNKKKELALDHKQLYALGLRHVQELSSKIWTDYNVHDPGITILELLAYSLTDLGYRSNYSVKDLLATEKDNAANMAKQFFTARQIFPNRALTLNDYRKVLADLEGVKNGWISKHELSYFADTVLGELRTDNPGLEGIEEINIAGLYDVTIEYADKITTTAQKEGIKKKVLSLLQSNRNLCEDFVGYKEIENQLFNLCCDLELESSADVSAVKAEIFYRVQDYLCPSIRFYSLSQMLERKKEDGTLFSADEIFDGPALNTGFIDDHELEKAELRTSINLSDIINLIMDIQGVVAVRDILVIPFPEVPDTPAILPENKWVVPVIPGRKPTLPIDFIEDANYFLKFYKRNMPVYPQASKVLAKLGDLYAEFPDKPAAGTTNDLPIPLGTFRNPEAYYSFQNDFPALYGLSEAGLTSTATDERVALAAQLKAYLLFFDQLMANYFSQLSHLKELFSMDPTIERTYFYQVVDSFAEYEKIYGPAAGDILTTLETKTEDQLVHTTRRNRFLDHLISRFAERFTDFANLVHSALGASPESIARYKCDFLANYPVISSERALAYNYTLNGEFDLWNSTNVSGLEKRLSKLLAIPNFARRNLSSVNYTIYSEIDTTPGDEFRFRVRNSLTGKIILSSSTHYLTEDKALEAMKLAIQTGMQPSGYEKKKTVDNRYYFNVTDGSGEVIARRIEYFDTEEEMNAALEDLINYLQRNYSDEGMFLIENILLRPVQEGDPFLPVCKASMQSSCADFDPYSYRIHVILPAENGRFKYMPFRRFVEEIIREETPAHILSKICWISKEDMSVLENAYHDWILLKSGKDGNDRLRKLQKFIASLYEVRNIYPSELLRACDTNEPKFILGDTAIGSQEN
ncbi:MAG: hypothetical protein WCI31_10090 [Prolixibacteraceae bacterium]